MKHYVIKNGTVFRDNKLTTYDVEIKDGIIVNIAEDLEHENVIDAKGLVVSPSFIDVHVHLRDPGFTQSEDIISGAKSALAGGYSHIFAMPNTSPTMDNVAMINQFNETASLSKCNVKTFSAISKDLKGQEVVNIEEIAKLDIAGFSDDGRGFQDDEKMLEAMVVIDKWDKLLSVHCEDESELENGCVFNLGHVSKKSKLPGINNASEYNMLKRDLTLIKENKLTLKYHMCHISTKESLDLIRDFQNEVDVSCEVTPHHLILSDDDIDISDNNYKMNPPLRSKSDKQAMIDGINDGTIKIIATDHAPHQKEGIEVSKAPFGIIGLELAFSTLYTNLVQKHYIQLEKILAAMSINPAKRFGIEHGIEVGNIANIILLDLEQDKIYDKTNILSKSINTPFINQKLKGVINRTIINGEVVIGG